MPEVGGHGHDLGRHAEVLPGGEQGARVALAAGLHGADAHDARGAEHGLGERPGGRGAARDKLLAGGAERGGLAEGPDALAEGAGVPDLVGVFDEHLQRRVERRPDRAGLDGLVRLDAVAAESDELGELGEAVGGGEVGEVEPEIFAGLVTERDHVFPRDAGVLIGEGEAAAAVGGVAGIEHAGGENVVGQAAVGPVAHGGVIDEAEVHHADVGPRTVVEAGDERGMEQPLVGGQGRTLEGEGLRAGGVGQPELQTGEGTAASRERTTTLLGREASVAQR